MEKYIEELLEKVLNFESKPQIIEIYKRSKKINFEFEDDVKKFIDLITLEE